MAPRSWTVPALPGLLVLVLVLIVPIVAASPAVAGGPVNAGVNVPGRPGPPAPATPGPHAGNQVNRAVQALRTSTLYVAAGASPVDAGELRRALNGATSVVVAVLAAASVAEAGGEAAGLPGQIAAGLDRAGTVIVLVGRQVALSSIGADQAVLGQALDGAQAALDAGSGTRAQVTAVLARLVQAVRAAPSAFPFPTEEAPRRAGSPSAWTGYVAVLLVLAGAGAASAWVLRRGRRRRPGRLPRRRVHVDASGRLISVEDVGQAR